MEVRNSVRQSDSVEFDSICSGSLKNGVAHNCFGVIQLLNQVKDLYHSIDVHGMPELSVDVVQS